MSQPMETPWIIIESYFKNHHLKRLVRHHIESYNALINSYIAKTIDMFNPVCIHSPHDLDEDTKLYSLEIWVTFTNFNIYRPQIYENNGARKLMFPQEARLRNFTYSASMMVDLEIKIVRRFGKKLSQMETFYKILPKIQIGKIPVMLKSDICILKQYRHLHPNLTGECKFDAGGYFIINGSEKTVLIQERAAENRVYCFNVKKNNNKWSWLAEIKSVPDYKCISPKQINMTIATRNNGFGHNIYVQIPRIKNPIPLFVLFRALGIVSDKEICRLILLDIEAHKMKRMLYAVKAAIIEASQFVTQEEALTQIISSAMFTPINMDRETGIARKRQFTIDVLDNDLFPHCNSKIEKLYFLGYMVNQLLQCSFGWKPIDDRDNYKNKRLDLTGTLLNNLFRNYFNKVVKDMQKQLVREINNGSWRSMGRYRDIINTTNVYKIIKSTTIENGLKRALATGDFGIKNPHSTKVGVAQVLNRLTYISTLSHLRRVNTPIDKSGKLIPPRKLHNSQWGFICPAESPEGAPVGVVKNLSYMSHVTIKSSRDPLYDIIRDQIISLEMAKYEEYFEKVKVFINGAWIGNAKHPQQLYTFIKAKKYTGYINIYTSIIFDYERKEIRICNDAGRLTRPLLRVKNGKLLITDEQKSDTQEKEAISNFAGDFKETLSYLNSVSDKKTLKHERKRQRRKKRIAAKNVRVQSTQIINTKITTKDDPPYGILKGGKKPLYSDYRRTLRNKERSPMIKFAVPMKDEKKPETAAAKATAAATLVRQKKLERLRKKMRTPSLTRKRKLKRYTLGKRKGKIGILIKSRETRRKIKKEHDNLKKVRLSTIKLYLKKHGLLKVGSNAPEKVMRDIYETAVLAGDVYNKSGDVLYHNFMNDKKT